MDYRNHDGSTAEMCGNGIRVFARYLAERGLATGPAFTVATRSGFRRVRLEEDGNVTAEMGAVAVLGPGRAVLGGPGGLACEGLRVSVGNPHLACLVDAPLAGFDLTGPPLLDPAQFPEGGNVELVRVTGPGTAADAGARARLGRDQILRDGRGGGRRRSRQAAAGQDQGSWQVSVPGGQLTVMLESGAGWLRGPAVIVAEGELDDAWLAAASRRRPLTRQAGPIPVVPDPAVMSLAAAGHVPASDLRRGGQPAGQGGDRQAAYGRVQHLGGVRHGRGRRHRWRPARRRSAGCSPGWPTRPGRPRSPGPRPPSARRARARPPAAAGCTRPPSRSR